MTTIYATSKKEIKAQFYDLDPMDVVWHGNYVRFFEDARCELLNKIGYNYEEMKDSGYTWPIVDLHIRYTRPITFGQEVTIQTDLVEYEFRLKIVYTIYDKKRIHEHYLNFFLRLVSSKYRIHAWRYYNTRCEP